MGGAVAVGRIGGVLVRVHWSVVVIAVLLAWSLSSQLFPTSYPEASTLAAWAAGTVAAVVFLLGVLAHELTHAVVARRNGVRVEGITLWLFGGVARLQDEAPDPGAELRIAGSGPLVSLLLGVGFGLAAGVLSAAGFDGLPVGALAWLAGINLLLAVFNILPGAPLDGGRLLRAALWKWRGDRLWATIAAARAGRGLGIVLIGLGLAELLALGSVAGLWLALIGWFILGAAFVEEQQARLTGSLAGVRAGDVMTPDPDTAPVGISVAEFVERYLLQRRHTTFLLTDATGRAIGLVTAGRVKALPRDRWAQTPISAVACPMSEVPVAAPEEPLFELLHRLDGPTGGRALVLDRGQPVGIISPLDITRAIERSAFSRPATTTRSPRTGAQDPLVPRR
ncbi:MAG TPA: site-2 protease family protein [Actinomycetes bacterium]|nr:site-2 protease family protein [Actinomycetes bacterium]